MNRFEKGEISNPKGRPRKIITNLKNAGYKKAEVQMTFDKLAAITMDELKELKKKKDLTILELGLIRMAEDFLNSKKPSGEFLEYILSKKQSSETVMTVEDKREMTHEETKEEAVRRGIPASVFEDKPKK